MNDEKNSEEKYYPIVVEGYVHGGGGIDTYEGFRDPKVASMVVELLLRDYKYTDSFGSIKLYPDSDYPKLTLDVPQEIIDKVNYILNSSID